MTTLSFLHDSPGLRGLPEMLLLATRCVQNGAMVTSDFPVLAGLDALAKRKKPVRVAQEARRLQQALRQAS